MATCCNESAQETLDFRRVAKRIPRCGEPRFFAYEDADAALFDHAEGVFVGTIVSDVNRENVPAFQARRFQQPDQRSAFVPINIRLKFVNFFAGHFTQFAMSPSHFAHRLSYSW